MAVKFRQSNLERVLIPLLAVAATTAAATAAEVSLLLLSLKRADSDRNKGDDDALIIPILHSELAIALPALLFRALSVLAGRGPVVPPEVVKPAYVDGIKSAAAANATTNAR